MHIQTQTQETVSNNLSKSSLKGLSTSLLERDGEMFLVTSYHSPYTGLKLTTERKIKFA